jgi:enoyl-CoA hydratase
LIRKGPTVSDTPEFQRSKVSRSGGTAILSLAGNKVNALDREVLQEITLFVEFAVKEPEVDAIVLTGEGSVFSAGVNVTEVLAHEKSYTSELLLDLEAALVSLFRCPKPTVAAINGSAIAGGCLLACTCDKRLIADEARIGVTELRVGVAFPAAAVELLRHTCGSRAEQLIFDAGLLTAEEACQYGLAHRSMPRSEVLAEAMKEAEKLASLDARAYALAKEAVRRTALAAFGDGRQLLDHQVHEQWQDDRTRENLENLLKPKA